MKPEKFPESDDPWAVGPLGSTVATFRQPVPGLVALCAFAGAELLAIGGWFIAQALGATKPFVGGIQVVAGAFIIAVGLSVFLNLLLTATLNVYLCERGFYVDNFRCRRVFPWASIRIVIEDVVHRYKTARDLDEGRLHDSLHYFRVTNSEGQTFHFGEQPPSLGIDASAPPAAPLEAALREAAIKFGFAWELNERRIVCPRGECV